MVISLIRWFLKTSAIMLLWVFILSFKWEGKTFHSYLNSMLIQRFTSNNVEYELSGLFGKILLAVDETYKKVLKDKAL